MKQKLTPWFPATTLPVREGEYRTKCHQFSCNAYHYFKDGQWYASSSLCVPVKPLPWRGVNK